MIPVMRLIRTFGFFLLSAFALTLSGCASLEWAAPEVSGRVIDAASHAPLAHVAVYRSEGGQAEPVGETDADGRFHVSPKKKMYVSSPLAAGESSRSSHLEFALAGYARAYFDTTTYIGEAKSPEHPIFDSVVVEMHQDAAESSYVR